jgi:hypothetical protein
MLGSEIDHALAIVQKDTVGQNQERVRLFPGDRVKCAVQLPRRAHFQSLQLYSQRLGCSERLPHRYRMKRIQRIEEEGDVRELGNYFPQQLQPFALKVRRDRAQSRDVSG